MITFTVGSIPVLTHGDVLYGTALTEVSLQKDGGSQVSYTVSAGQIAPNPVNIIITGHGMYSTPGTYVWTIKSTGYEDAVVTVQVQ